MMITTMSRKLAMNKIVIRKCSNTATKEEKYPSIFSSAFWLGRGWRGDFFEVRRKYFTSDLVGADNPTYLKRPVYDGFRITYTMLCVGFGLFSVGVGLKNMALGINKRK